VASLPLPRAPTRITVSELGSAAVGGRDRPGRLPAVGGCATEAERTLVVVLLPKHGVQHADPPAAGQLELLRTPMVARVRSFRPGVVSVATLAHDRWVAAAESASVPQPTGHARCLARPTDQVADYGAGCLQAEVASVLRLIYVRQHGRRVGGLVRRANRHPIESLTPSTPTGYTSPTVRLRHPDCHAMWRITWEREWLLARPSGSVARWRLIMGLDDCRIRRLWFSTCHCVGAIPPTIHSSTSRSSSGESTSRALAHSVLRLVTQPSPSSLALTPAISGTPL
jgi:hypothetical protein